MEYVLYTGHFWFVGIQLQMCQMSGPLLCAVVLLALLEETVGAGEWNNSKHQMALQISLSNFPYIGQKPIDGIKIFLP